MDEGRDGQAVAQERRSAPLPPRRAHSTLRWSQLAAQFEAGPPELRMSAGLALIFPLVSAGQFSEAREVLDALRRGQTTQTPDARLAARAAWIALEWGDLDRAGRALRAAVGGELCDAFELDLIAALEFAIGSARGSAIDPPVASLERLAMSAPFAELAIGVAIHAARAGYTEAAARIAAIAGPGSPSRLLLEGSAALARGEHASARRVLELAADAAQGALMPRVAGRALLAAAHAAAAVGDTIAPGELLARAHAFVSRHGSPSEQLELRRAYRRYGRRAIDRLVTASIAVGLDQLFDARRRIDDALTELAEHDSPTLPLGHHTGRARAAVETLAEAERALTKGIGDLLAERARAADLVLALGALARVDSPDALPRTAAEMAARLFGADGVVVALREQGMLMASGIAGEPDACWREHCAADAPAACAAREGPELRGARLALPLAVPGGERGWIYIDRARRQGNFTAGDAMDLALFAEYVAVALARADAAARAAAFALRLESALSALRDGVLALDDARAIVVVNPAARRMLALPAEVDAGTPLASLPHLAPLAERLRRRELPDNDAMRLGGMDMVISARPFPLASGREGLVVTLIDLGRARAIAGAGSGARFTFADLVGQAPEFQRAVAIARAAAPLDTTLLIIGESGTGKELFAQAIHNEGPRAAEPFVAINCAALPRELIESELFGHERGAFTGARAGGAPGKLDLAGAGTLLLDEIGEMPLDLQAKLLRVLQERRYVPVGGTRERTLNARVIATTNRDLEIEVQRGTFRLDLYHRLRVLFIQLPPLRKRPGDVPLLVAHTLRETAPRYGKRVREIAPELLARFEQHSWPGNVRELVNVVEAEVALAPPEARMLTRLPPHFAPAPGGDESGRFHPIPATVRPLEEVERDAVLAALTACEGNVAAAARGLGISKVTLYAKLKHYGVDPGELRRGTPAGGLPMVPKRER